MVRRMATPKADFASHILGRRVEDFIRDRRDAGRTWRQIVADLEEATGGVIRTVPETVRSWHLGNKQDAA
jgi:hypothetical protein